MTYYNFFDINSLLSKEPDALQTYRFQAPWSRPGLGRPLTGNGQPNANARHPGGVLQLVREGKCCASPGYHLGERYAKDIDSGSHQFLGM